MKVFLCESIHKDAYELLKSKAEIISDFAGVCEADAIINRNLHIDREWMLKCPNLKVIGIHGTGTDGVDLAAASELGIKVFNVPNENSDSVAELIIAFMLNLARKVQLADRMLLAGQINSIAPKVLEGNEISRKTFGMVGCGNIAMRAARRLKNGFDMNIVGYSPSLNEEKAKELGIGFCSSIEAVFEQADFVNIGVPLNENTKGLITGEIFEHAKQKCILINTSRGAVVDEEALLEALQSGKIMAAASDVFKVEPPAADNPLLGMPNFLATPHIGAATDEALYRVGMGTVRRLIQILEDGCSTQ